jgi:hypothetical protein
MELAESLEECLRRFDDADSVEVRENGSRVATVEKFSWELRGAPAKPILRLSLEQYSATHRILAIRKDSGVSLTLSIERFGTARPGRLEFVRVGYVRPSREVARQDFSSRLARVLSERFPDDVVESLKSAPDLEHSFSSNYARGVLRHGSARWALLAVSDSETIATSENSLTFGLLWLAQVCETAREGYVAGLRLIVAKGAGAILVHLVKALSSSVAVEIYEFEPRNESITRVDPNALANHATWLVQPRERQSLLDRSAAELDPIVAHSKEAITLHPNIQSGEIVLRFRGLAFASWENRVVYFGGAVGRRKKLTASTEIELKQMLSDLEIHRHPLATDTRHAWYRAQPERWLETIVRNDVTRVDAKLDPRFVYTQVFANSATERSILDILTITTSGRLAIIELKGSEHIHLPLQAADYWIRIRHHLEQGDFSRYGYFPQVQVQKAPPLVFLVAPALRFHSTTGPLLRYLSSSIEVARIGIAESWRRGVRVVMRQ